MSVANKSLNQGELALVSKGDVLEITASSESGVLVFVGEPINEPIVHYGPFVMNSMQEIQQAINDYNSGVFDSY